jgi:2-polyprenyl-3-methyl-5-hydroxy-6-metoxy-1,4-benzoquinol methylase
MGNDLRELPASINFSERAQLSELMDEPCSRDTLRACLRDISRTNRWTFASRPLLHWLDAVLPASSPPTDAVRILDVGCGYGDGLRRIEQWATSRRIAVELVGLDLNPDATAIAREVTPTSSAIRWVTADVLKYDPPQPPHLVVSSLFTHHLNEQQIIQFIRWMEGNAVTGWFINDLSRAALPYYFFRTFARVAGLHPFVQYDGPVSIARSFVAEDWRRMCAAAGLREGEFEIQPFKPARLCVARSRPR